MGCFNKHLLYLKLLLYCFLGGIGCLYPFLTYHMRHIGLNATEIRLIQCAAAFLSAVIAPFVAFLADKCGRPKRICVVLFLLTAFVALTLLLVPPVNRVPHRAPKLQLRCTADGSEIIQERCKHADSQEDQVCREGSASDVGKFVLTSCEYDCTSITPGGNIAALNASSPLPSTTSEEPTAARRRRSPDADEGSGDDEFAPLEEDLLALQTHKAPHLCLETEGKPAFCHVYMNHSSGIELQAALPRFEVKDEACVYPLENINTNTETYSTLKCLPLFARCDVKCKAKHSSENSVLEFFECSDNYGDIRATFWPYLLLRSLTEALAIAAITLSMTLLIIVTQEHKGDLGNQLLWGALGFGGMAPTLGFLLDIPELDVPYVGMPYALCFFSFTGMMISAAMVTAMLPLRMEGRPISTYREWTTVCKGEVAALLLVLFLLGTLHGVLDDIAPLFFLSKGATSKFLLGLTITVGMFPAVLFMWRCERIVDYCGYANIFMVAFVFYIMRFTGYAYLPTAWCCLLVEIMEVITLTLMWSTAALYMHQMAPRSLLATGQSLAIVSHFSIGRGLGIAFAIWAIPTLGYPWMYKSSAIFSTVIAILYFTIYYACIKPQCIRTSRRQELLNEGTLGNGTYTPLRAYGANGRGKTPGVRG